MGYGVRVSHVPDPEAPGTGRAGRGESRLTLCRYLTHRGPVLERCSAEAVEPDAEIELCLTHLAAALELITRRQALATQDAS